MFTDAGPVRVMVVGEVEQVASLQGSCSFQEVFSELRISAGFFLLGGTVEVRGQGAGGL